MDYGKLSQLETVTNLIVISEINPNEHCYKLITMLMNYIEFIKMTITNDEDDLTPINPTNLLCNFQDVEFIVNEIHDILYEKQLKHNPITNKGVL